MNQIERDALAVVDAAANDPSDLYSIGYAEANALKRMLA
jgi:hypothetical protein